MYRYLDYDDNMLSEEDLKELIDLEEGNLHNKSIPISKSYVNLTQSLTTKSISNPLKNPVTNFETNYDPQILRWEIEDDPNKMVLEKDDENFNMELAELSFDLSLERKKRDLNDSIKFKNSLCYCCKNYLIIHPVNEYIFIEKYNKKNKIKNYRPSSTNIKLLYRLRPELFINLKCENYRYIDNIQINRVRNYEDMIYQYEIYFYDYREETNNEKDYYTCSICDRNYCEKHLDFNPLHISKCKYCTKRWYICTWCKYDRLCYNLDLDGNLHEDFEKDLCNFFHG